jgi:hypothetical protein
MEKGYCSLRITVPLTGMVGSVDDKCKDVLCVVDEAWELELKLSWSWRTV